MFDIVAGNLFQQGLHACHVIHQSVIAAGPEPAAVESCHRSDAAMQGVMLDPACLPAAGVTRFVMVETTNKVVWRQWRRFVTCHLSYSRQVPIAAGRRPDQPR